jgi:uncharacterized protein DUF3995
MSMGHKSQERSGWALWASYAVIAWCVVFGVLHLYWALGGSAGFAQFSIPSNQTLVATRDPGYIRLTWAVGLVCIYGAIVTLATLQAWGRYIPRWIVLTTLWVACVLCIVRGLGNPIQDLTVLAGILPFEALDGPQAIAWYRWMLLDAILFSPWFTLGGLAFGVTAWSVSWRGSDLAARGLVRAVQG